MKAEDYNLVRECPYCKNTDRIHECQNCKSIITNKQCKNGKGLCADCMVREYSKEVNQLLTEAINKERFGVKWN